jgi:Flp pilus assembly CpaE family ATPase
MSAEPIRVLLVDDDEDDYVVARDLLQEVAGDRYRIKWAPTYREAAEEIRRGRHDVYIVDYRLGSRSGLDLLRDELDEGRRGPAIVLTGQGNREIDVEAMNAGAAAYLVKGDYSAEDLERALRYALQRFRANNGNEAQPQRPSAKNPRVLSFLGAKGGVGTTTVAINVACALAREGREVAAVDLRGHFGMMARYLDLAPNNDVGDLALLDPPQIDSGRIEGHLTRHQCGLRLLPGPTRASKFRVVSAEHSAAIVRMVADAADFTIVDLPVAPCDSNREAALASEFVAIVLERESGCVAAAKTQIDVVRSSGTDAELGIVVVDRVPVPTPVPLSEITSLLGASVYGVVPCAIEVAYPSASAGIPMVMSSPDREISRSLAGLAERLAAPQLRPIPV